MTANYEIIAGERRWRAAQKAGLHDVPIAIVEATDAQSLEFAIIENVQRADLNALEEAAGYAALMEQFDHTQEQVAKIVGKSRPHVANTLRLLKLAPPVQHFVRSGKLSAGHARLLVGVPDAEQIAWRAMEHDMSVRQLEDELRADRERHAMDVPEGKKPRKAKAGQGSRHRGAGAAAVGRVGPAGDHRPPAASAARCTSSTAISISWTWCCGSWERGE